MDLLLSDEECGALAEAAIDAGLDRTALLRGLHPRLTGDLPLEHTPNEQRRSDVRELNRRSPVSDGDACPVIVWVANAHTAAGRLPQAALFSDQLSRLIDKMHATGAQPASEALRKPTVFLSHSSRDKPAVQRLDQALVGELGRDSVFLDSKSIELGDLWSTKIREGLKGANVFVLWLTNNVRSSQWVPYELCAAEFLGATIIPIFAETGVQWPEFISRYQGIEHDPSKPTETVRKLLTRLGISLPTPPPEPPPDGKPLPRSDKEGRSLLELIRMVEGVGPALVSAYVLECSLAPEAVVAAISALDIEALMDREALEIFIEEGRAAQIAREDLRAVVLAALAVHPEVSSAYRVENGTFEFDETCLPSIEVAVARDEKRGPVLEKRGDRYAGAPAVLDPAPVGMVTTDAGLARLYEELREAMRELWSFDVMTGKDIEALLETEFRAAKRARATAIKRNRKPKILPYLVVSVTALSPGMAKRFQKRFEGLRVVRCRSDQPSKAGRGLALAQMVRYLDALLESGKK